MKTSLNKLTKIVLLAGVAVLLALEAYVLIMGDNSATISRVALTWSVQHPGLVLGWGILSGHLWWPQWRTKA